MCKHQPHSPPSPGQWGYGSPPLLFQAGIELLVLLIPLSVCNLMCVPLHPVCVIWRPRRCMLGRHSTSGDTSWSDGLWFHLRREGVSMSLWGWGCPPGLLRVERAAWLPPPHTPIHPNLV